MPDTAVEVLIVILDSEIQVTGSGGGFPVNKSVSSVSICGEYSVLLPLRPLRSLRLKGFWLWLWRANSSEVSCIRVEAHSLPEVAIPNRKNKDGLTDSLDGIFRGLGDLLQTAVKMAESAQESKQDGEGLRAVYGVSVRMGPGNARTVENFGNLRQRPGHKPVITEFREPVTDVLDEGDHLLVVVELPGIDETAVAWKLNGATATISAQAHGRKYLKKIILPALVDEKRTTSSYKNGILELKLWKQQAH